MRRLTVAFLAVGCLALLVGTYVGAGAIGARGHSAFALCASGTYDEEACDNGKVRYCHFNEGGDGTGRAHCGNASSYAAHVGPGVVVGHSQKDFCITNAQEEADCIAGKSSQSLPSSNGRFGLVRRADKHPPASKAGGCSLRRAPLNLRAGCSSAALHAPELWGDRV